MSSLSSYFSYKLRKAFCSFTFQKRHGQFCFVLFCFAILLWNWFSLNFDNILKTMRGKTSVYLSLLEVPFLWHFPFFTFPMTYSFKCFILSKPNNHSHLTLFAFFPGFLLCPSISKLFQGFILVLFLFLFLYLILINLTSAYHLICRPSLFECLSTHLSPTYLKSNLLSFLSIPTTN